MNSIETFNKNILNVIYFSAAFESENDFLINDMRSLDDS